MARFQQLDLGRVFAHAIVRRLAALLVLAVLAYFGMGNASAHTIRCQDAAQISARNCDEGSAFADSKSDAVATEHCKVRFPNVSHFPNPTGVVTASQHYAGGLYYVSDIQCRASDGGTFNTNELHYYAKGCSTRTDLTGGHIRGSNATHVCHDGCRYDATNTGKVTIDLNGTGEGWMQSTDGFKPTGQTCAPKTELPSNEEDCIPIEGQTVCKLPDGQLCYSLSSSRRNCWTPSETGQKTDGEKVQVRNQGSTPIPPNIGQPTQPTGETPITTTTTTTPPSGGNPSVTVITTGNHATVSGGPAGSSNEGQSTTPDGKGTTGSTGGTTGGTGTGTDLTATNAKLGEIKGDTGNILDKLGDLVDGFTGEGGEDIPGPGDGENPEDLDVIEEGTVDASALDMSGFAGGSCVAMPSVAGPLGQAFTAAANGFGGWCNFIAVIRALFITLATITGVYILAGRNI